MYVTTLSEHLAAAGHEVCVLTTTAIDHDALYDPALLHTTGGEEILNGVQVLRMPPDFKSGRQAVPPDFSSAGMETFIDHLHRGQFDIVNGYCFPFATLLSCADRAARALNCPLLLTPFFHSHPLLAGHFQSVVLKEQLQQANRIICQTAHESDFFQQQWLLPQQIMEVAGVGVDAIGPAMDSRRSPEPDSCFRVLFLGSNDRLKGAESVIRLSERFAHEPVQFIMAGGQTENFKRYLHDRGMPANGNLEVLGRVSERCKHDLLMETNVLLLPSIAESFGQVYLEAWLRKKPVIGINYGATASLIDHDRDGLLVDFEDIDAMETALRRYLADPSLRHRHGNAGYLKARRYDWPLICRKLEDIYRSLEESGSKPKLS